MATTFGKEYRRLIQRFPLRPLKDEAQYDVASQLVRELAMKGEQLTEDETDYMLVLGRLVSDYERRLPAVQKFMADVNRITPAEALAYLMEQSGLSQVELAEKTGVTQSLISLCLSGKRQFSKRAIVSFSRYFQVSPELFLARD